MTSPKTTRNRRIHLAAHAVGLAPAFTQQTDPLRKRYDLAAVVRAAQVLEAARFDAVFEADAILFDLDETDSIYSNLHVDATVAMAALAAVTTHIGLVTTATTTFNVPYVLARQLQTLDQLSGGRVGWNAVTSFGGEGQFGLHRFPDQDERYRRAEEFTEIVQGLWRGWSADAVGVGPDGRPRITAGKVRRTTFSGEHLSVDGALGIPRSPQGWPVQFQAGASDVGLAFAGRHAEAIFSASPDLEHARVYRRRLDAAVASARGADARRPLVLTGVHLIAAATEAEAKEREAALVEALDLAAGRRSLALAFGAIVAKENEGAARLELADLELDEPIPAERLDALPDPQTLDRRRSRTALYHDLARQGLSLRELIAEHLLGHAHLRVTGSFEQVTDELVRWFDQDVVDGFVLRFEDGLASITGFTEEVVPRLQDLGLFRREYEGSTLRENLGLPLPT